MWTVSRENIENLGIKFLIINRDVIIRKALTWEPGLQESHQLTISPAITTPLSVRFDTSQDASLQRTSVKRERSRFRSYGPDDYADAAETPCKKLSSSTGGDFDSGFYGTSDNERRSHFQQLTTRNRAEGSRVKRLSGVLSADRDADHDLSFDVETAVSLIASYLSYGSLTTSQAAKMQKTQRRILINSPSLKPFGSCCNWVSIRQLKPDRPFDGDLINTIVNLLGAPLGKEGRVYFGTNFCEEIKRGDHAELDKRVESVEEDGRWMFAVCEDSCWLAVCINWTRAVIQYYDPQPFDLLAERRPKFVTAVSALCVLLSASTQANFLSSLAH